MNTADAWRKLQKLARYYQIGVVNMAFGIAVYSILVWMGMNIFLAQLSAQVVGVAFNYFTYSTHVFQGSSPAKIRFLLSYVVNYFVALIILAAISYAVHSPYLAGIITAFIVSVFNYLVLRQLVFRAAQK